MALKNLFLEISQTEVKAKDLGEIIMDHLKKLDRVSYVRFASFYWDYRDIEDFVYGLKNNLHSEKSISDKGEKRELRQYAKPQKRSLGREYAFKFIYKHLLSDFVREKNQIISDDKSFEEALNLFDLSYYEEDSEHPDNVIDPHTKYLLAI